MADVTYIYFFICGTLGFTLLAAGVFFLLLKHRNNQHRYETEKKDREYQYTNELLHTRLEVQEQLLNQVSSEIHDNVGQLLSVVKLNLFSLGNQPANGKSSQLIETSSALLDKAIEDLRNISHSQNGNLFNEIGLQEAIAKELSYINDTKQQDCTLEITGVPFTLPPDKELLIYRIIQEAIHNSIRHAQCSNLTVSLKYGPGSFTMSVFDNGIGLDVSGTAITKGMGITNMRYRAEMLGSNLEISTVPPQGTLVTLKVNLN